MFGLLITFVVWLAAVTVCEDPAAAFAARDFAEVEATASAAWEASGGRDGVAAANLAAVHAIRGRLEEAREWQAEADRALVAAGRDDLHKRLALARAVLAYIDSRQYGNDEPDDAIAALEDADGTAAEAGRVAAEIFVRSNRGERAQRGYAEYLRLIDAFRASGDSLSLAHSLTRLSRVEGSTGGHGTARDGFQEAFEIFDALDRGSDANLALRNAAVARWKVGDSEGSLAALLTVVERARASGDVRAEMLALNDASMVLASTGRHEEAVAFDVRANDALRRFAKSVADHGAVSEDVARFYKMRFVGKPTYTVDLFDGFYSALALPGEVAP